MLTIDEKEFLFKLTYVENEGIQRCRRQDKQRGLKGKSSLTKGHEKGFRELFQAISSLGLVNEYAEYARERKEKRNTTC